MGLKVAKWTDEQLADMLAASEEAITIMLNLNDKVGFDLTHAVSQVRGAQRLIYEEFGHRAVARHSRDSHAQPPA